LVLPLTRHNLSVGSSDFDTSEEASLVVHIGDDATVSSIATSRAIVRSLRAGVAIRRPAKRMASKLGGSSQESVLLFDTVPGFLGSNLFRVPNLVGIVAEVGVSRNQLFESCIFPAPALTDDHDVVTTTEGVFEDSNRLEDNLRVFCDGLIARGTIVVPFWDLVNGSDFSRKSTAFSAELETGAIKPDIFSDDGAILVDISQAV
jgi:hypothetical protein